MISRRVVVSCLCLAFGSAILVASEPGTDRQMVLTLDDLPAQRAQALPEERVLAINEGLLPLLTEQLFDREIPQILLLHANALNADYLGELVGSLRRRGYPFVDLDTALEDLAYSSEETYTGPGGITWLHRWALTRNVDPSLFRGEPATAAWVQEVAGLQE